jgi:hypothetical protein
MTAIIITTLLVVVLWLGRDIGTKPKNKPTNTGGGRKNDYTKKN